MKLKLKRIDKKIAAVQEDNNATEQLDSYYFRDIEAIDRLIQTVKDSNLTAEDKEQQLHLLYNAKRNLLNSYKEEVEKRKEENEKELENYYKMIDDAKKEAEVQKHEMEKNKRELVKLL